ncbi:hypothetical protein IWQ62_000602 [Dispira parvispora]|uniref:Uncharacterized protein n=1 Tax=Dispira parvispora TaxID=1520584 RepID=A0A9W8B0A5_9FUNG|nr:hypothetical protein IWQ62_000602 [Dispira parvispora]
MQGFIFKRRQREQVWWCLAGLLVLTVVVGLYPVYGATQLLNGGDLLPKEVSSQDFYYDDVKHYHYRGPLVKMDIKEDCKVTVNEVPRLTTLDWAASAGMAANESDVGTIVFFDRLEFMDGKCQTFTDVLKQLEGIVPELADKGYPPVKVGLFSCVLTSESNFGGLDYEPIDDYYYHKVSGIEIAQIGLDTGLMFANVMAGLAANATDGSFVPLVVQVTQERGPWNEFLYSSVFKGYLIFCRISFVPGILYAVYEFFRLTIKSKLRFQLRYLIFLVIIFVMVVDTVLTAVDALSRFQNVIRFVSWMLGFGTQFLVLIMWLRIMRKILPSRTGLLLIWLTYFILFCSSVANAVLIVWSITQISFILYFGWGIHSYVVSPSMYVLAVLMVWYGYHITRDLDRMGLYSGTLAALKRLCLLSYAAFSGGLMTAIALMLVITSITQYTQVCIIRTVAMQFSHLILFTSTFWILRVRDSSALNHQELRSGSGSDNGRAKEASIRLDTLANNKLKYSGSKPSTTNIPLAIPSNELYFPGKCYPSEGKAAGGLGMLQPNFSNPPNQTDETWAVGDYPNPLQYFEGATNKNEPSNKSPTRP